MPNINDPSNYVKIFQPDPSILTLNVGYKFSNKVL